MKRMKHILNGFIALAMVLMFTQCTDNKANEQGASTPAVVGGPVNMKIAYVEIDSLLTKYRYWNDLNEMMIQRVNLYISYLHVYRTAYYSRS